MQSWIKIVCLLGMLPFVSGCAATAYYGQAVRGQLELLHARQPVEQLLTDPDVSPELAEQLRKTGAILDFAEQRGLPVGNSYRSYADLKRPFVVWNVFAAKQDQVSLIQHCFPIAGCVGYKGYFSEADARAFADELAQSGFDVFVGGVAAYSTLGWFDDPLLNTFVFRTDQRLAAVLFHELAHKVLYVEGDTVFNESFATTVERHLLSEWLLVEGREALFAQYMQAEARRDEVIRLILKTREQLDAVYQSNSAAAEKAHHKALLLARLKADYRKLKAGWPEGNAFESWMSQDLNNAHLAAIGAYQGQVPAFNALLAKAGNLQAFFLRAEQMAEIPRPNRDAALASVLSE